MKLFCRERNGAMVVCGIAKRRERDSECRQREKEDAFDGRRRNCDTGGTEAAIQENLGNQPTEGMPNDQWWAVQTTNDLLVVVDDRADSQRRDRRRVTPKLLDVAIHSRPTAGNDGIPASSIASDPVLPTERCHPKSMDQDD